MACVCVFMCVCAFVAVRQVCTSSGGRGDSGNQRHHFRIWPSTTRGCVGLFLCMFVFVNMFPCSAIVCANASADGDGRGFLCFGLLKLATPAHAYTNTYIYTYTYTCICEDWVWEDAHYAWHDRRPWITTVWTLLCVYACACLSVKMCMCVCLYVICPCV